MSVGSTAVTSCNYSFPCLQHTHIMLRHIWLLISHKQPENSTFAFPLFSILLRLPGASPMAQWVKNLPVPESQEMWVRFLGQEDPLEEDIATHSSILAWEIPWTEEPGGLQSMGSQRLRHNWATEHYLPTFSAWEALTHFSASFFPDSFPDSFLTFSCQSRKPSSRFL